MHGMFWDVRMETFTSRFRTWMWQEEDQQLPPDSRGGRWSETFMRPPWLYFTVLWSNKIELELFWWITDTSGGGRKKHTLKRTTYLLWSMVMICGCFASVSTESLQHVQAKLVSIREPKKKKSEEAEAWTSLDCLMNLSFRRSPGSHLHWTP